MWKKVKVIKVSQLKSLTINEIFYFDETKADIKSYVSEYYYKSPNRDWFWNICKSVNKLFWFIIVNTLIEDDFRQFIKNNQIEREKYYVEKKELKIKVVPEIASILKSSRHYSSILKWNLIRIQLPLADRTCS